MNNQPPPLPPASKTKVGWLMVLGMLIGNAVGGVLMAILLKLVASYKETQISVFIAPNLMLVPLLVGLIASWSWRNLHRSIGATALDALWCSFIGLAGGAIFLREGIICLLMAYPIMYVMMFAGMLLGRLWFRPDQTKVRLIILPLFLLFIVADSFQSSSDQIEVSDQVAINAPAKKVWPHVLAFPAVPEAPDYWLFRIGLPYPVATTNGGDYVGASRQCIFSDNIIIRETVAEFTPNEKLTFDIVEQPKHPEVYGHITLHRGQFVLKQNGDGTTTLTGSSWYTLHVRPAWYFSWWARDMSRAVHLRVMNHVKRLAEMKLPGPELKEARR